MRRNDAIPGNCGIYSIKNIKNGKMYVGQSSNISLRWTSHKSSLRTNHARNQHLQAAWNKYGEESFEFSIIELCDVNDLDAREEYWIRYFDTVKRGYNIKYGGSSSRGWKMSEEGRRNLSAALKGKRKPEGTGAKISARQKLYFETHIPTTSIPIVCLNTGEVFNNATDANKRYPSADISALHKQCKGNSRSCGKTEYGEYLVWAYLKDYEKMSTEEINERLHLVGFVASGKGSQKPVVCVETGVIFESCAIAAKYAGVKPASMCDCLHGRSRHAGKHPETGVSLSWAWAS